jgi:hypothetical protein
MWETLLEMEKPAHQQFGLSVLALYAAHVEAAGFFGVHIGHGAKIMVILRKG